ncbi:hypothetical protein D3C79_953690 [compost metagenome]
MEVIRSFERHFIHAGLHILIGRIERFNPAILVRFAAGKRCPRILLLFLQRDGNARWRGTGLLVKNMHAQGADRGAKGDRGKGQ